LTSAFVGLPGSSSEAQGNKAARNRFGNHVIVKYGEFYYDPSYGSTKQSEIKVLEHLALKDHGILLEGFRFNRKIMKEFYFYVDRKDSENKLDTKIAAEIRY